MEQVPETRIASDGDVTGLLLKWSKGDEQALDALMPLVYGELKRLADTGVIKPSTLVWKTGLREWVRAQQVRGLFGAIQSELIATTPPTLPGEPPRVHILPAHQQAQHSDQAQSGK